MRPGEYFEVEYEDDDHAHERCPLWPLTPDAWAVRSPDGDEWIEHLDGLNPLTGPSLSRPKRGGRGNAGLYPLYRFRERMDNRTLKTAMIRGLRLVMASGDFDGTPLVTTMVDEDGDPLPLVEGFGATLADEMKRAVERARGGHALVAAAAPGLAAAAGVLPIADVGAVAAVAADSPAGQVWLACSRGPSVPLGEQVLLALGRDVVMNGRFALVHDGDELIMAKRVAVADAPGVAEQLRGAVPGLAAFLPPGPREPGGSPRDALDGTPPPGARGPGGRGPEAADDLRTLWVDWDPHGERYKAWREVCRESSAEEMDPQRIDGAQTALHMCKAMERQGGDPRLWLERWLREKHLESSDRVAHELRLLTDVLFLAGSIDQLNMGGLHASEAVARRIAAIVEAYATPGRPTWEHARFYSGVGASEEVVAPALRSQVLRRVKEEYDVATARARTVPRGSPADGKGEGGGDGHGDGSRRGSGRGRGKGGRGAPAPAEG